MSQQRVSSANGRDNNANQRGGNAAKRQRAGITSANTCFCSPAETLSTRLVSWQRSLGETHSALQSWGHAGKSVSLEMERFFAPDLPESEVDEDVPDVLTVQHHHLLQGGRHVLHRASVGGGFRSPCDSWWVFTGGTRHRTKCSRVSRTIFCNPPIAHR